MTPNPHAATAVPGVLTHGGAPTLPARAPTRSEPRRVPLRANPVPGFHRQPCEWAIGPLWPIVDPDTRWFLPEAEPTRPQFRLPTHVLGGASV